MVCEGHRVQTGKGMWNVDMKERERVGKARKVFIKKLKGDLLSHARPGICAFRAQKSCLSNSPAITLNP